MIVAFSVSPAGGDDASGGASGASSDTGSVSAAVAEAVRVVRDSGLPNETNAMFTNIEGEWDEVMAVVKAAVMAIKEHAPRVSLVLKADLRDGVTDGLHTKVAALERHLS